MPSLLAAAKKEALAVLNEQRGVLTNEAGTAVARSEELARRAGELADKLIPGISAQGRGAA